MKTSELKCEITAEQVYPDGIPPIPEGWEVDRLAIPTSGECFLPHNGGLLTCGSSDHRIILRKATPKRKRRFLVEERGSPSEPWNNPWTSIMDIGEQSEVLVRPLKEVFPITKLQIQEHWNAADKAVGGSMTNIATIFAETLRRLGIEVEE